MSAINVHFEGTPGPEPVKYLGVFDDAGNPLSSEEWRQVDGSRWILRVVCTQDHDTNYWDETLIQYVLRIWRAQAPGLSSSHKIRNIMQSVRLR